VLAATPLLTVNEELKGKIQVTFEGTPVQNVHLVLLKILNNGNVPIASSDFELPLSFSFGEKSRILSAQVTDTKPKSLKPILEVEPQQIMLQPTLLNSGDTITVKLLFAQYGNTIEPDGRVIGVKEITRAADVNREGAWLIAIATGVVMLLGVIAGVWIGRGTSGQPPDLPGWFLVLISIVTLLTVATYNFRKSTIDK